MAEKLMVPVLNLGSVSAIPLGQGRCYVVGGESLAVFRQRDGRIFASSNRCPHGKGPLAEGLLGGGKVICPMHGHQFCLETGASSGGTESLQVFPVQEIDGTIQMNLESVLA
jgi:nitrite reductase (NADH) small subunit